MQRVYADYNATTPLDPQVLETMLPYLREHFGNASSVHTFGREARAAIDDVRVRLAKLLGAQVADNLRILYGGSVKPDNATSLMNEAEIDGALVGGASLDAQSFAKIVNY